jgi:hypothetical protein
MAQLVEINQVGKREDLRDFISIVDMKDKPLLGIIPKLPDQKNMLVTWQADAYAAPVSTGVADGVDVDTFENAAANRATIQNYGQKFRRTAMVGDLAENVSNVAGASAGELARSIDKKLEEVSRDIELMLGSDQDAQLETSSATPYKSRGLGSWVNNAAQTTLPVPSTFRTPTASINTGGAGALTEATWRGLLSSVFTQYGKRQNLVLVCGTTVKGKVSDFTATQQANSNAPISSRYYTAGLDSNKVTTNVTIYEGDFNTVELYPSLLLGATSAGAVSATEAPTRAYIIPTELFGMTYNRAPRVMKLSDQGGGPRALVDAICCLIVKNPLAFGKIAN